MMSVLPLIRRSPCKINLCLNILGRRKDGFHELETLFHPVPLHDVLTFRHADAGEGVQLSCDHPELPVDGTNLVHRAATRYLAKAGIRSGVRIHLEKYVPMAAGLGGGSANAAHTLLGLNELFGFPLAMEALDELAAGLGSDINFFLQEGPALAGGRGERIESLKAFPGLTGCGLFLYHPGFGISTPWAFRELARFPADMKGRMGRARELAVELGDVDPERARGALRRMYNSLEAPALEKYPVLAQYQDFLREMGALGALMSGSGSTTFGVFRDKELAESVKGPFEGRFGRAGWLAVTEL
jgi:4-diphosphocytidyl-2-C-methyl-D-erythritol kinase